jgi:hypothetical protein
MLRGGNIARKVKNGLKMVSLGEVNNGLYF